MAMKAAILSIFIAALGTVRASTSLTSDTNVIPSSSVEPPASEVFVDLVPCILTPASITEDTAGPYMMDIFYKGYWSGSPVIIVDPGDDLLTELVVNAGHGKCNAVYVGLPATTAQFAALSEYSATFKVRIVYFDVAETSEHPDFTPKLGIQAYFEGDLLSPSAIGLTAEGAAGARIVNPDLQTDPAKNNLFTRPIRITSTQPGATPIAQYLDEAGVTLTSDGFSGVAMMEYTNTTTSVEELRVFFSIGWFDLGSWAWVHHIVEWATKGVFMGERRFYLGAVVDDLFVATNEFLYDGEFNEGPAYRCSAEDYNNLIDVQNALNAQYSSQIITEHAFNGAGILQEVGSSYQPPYEETIVTVKGTKMTPPGLQSVVIPPDYLSVNVPLMEAEHAAGVWDSDALLQAVLASPNDAFIGSHTLTHLSRDELQASDCNTEDGANAQIAVISGMFDMDNYNWRSMVSPGITGLFNANCLQSGEANLMTCYPGDNTYDGVQTDVSLVNENNQFHSIYTTEATNGHAGMQIVPRFATFVYYNCVTGECLVNENEYIRRFVCGCSNLDPTNPDRGTCSGVGSVNGCNSDDDIMSFGSVDAIYQAESETTCRYMLMGRRDKYMFHQANIIPADDLDGQSSLEKWYVDIMATLSSFITFPVKSVKFDDLCQNFQEHEALDEDSPVVTASVDATGAIVGMTLESTGVAGVIPVTVPTSEAATISLGDLTPYDTETYGSDTTFYFTAGTAPTPAPKPSASELAPIDVTVVNVASVSMEEQEEAAVEGVEAAQEIAEIAGELGLVAADQQLFEPDVIEILESEAVVDIVSTAAPIISNTTDP